MGEDADDGGQIPPRIRKRLRRNDQKGATSRRRSGARAGQKAGSRSQPSPPHLQRPLVGQWHSAQNPVVQKLVSSWKRGKCGFGVKQGKFNFGFFDTSAVFLDWYATNSAHDPGAAILQFIVDSPLMASSLYFDIETYIPCSKFNKESTEGNFFTELKKWLFELLPELGVDLHFLENLMYMDRVAPRETPRGMKLVYIHISVHPRSFTSPHAPRAYVSPPMPIMLKLNTSPTHTQSFHVHFPNVLFPCQKVIVNVGQIEYFPCGLHERPPHRRRTESCTLHELHRQ